MSRTGAGPSRARTPPPPVCAFQRSDVVALADVLTPARAQLFAFAVQSPSDTALEPLDSASDWRLPVWYSHGEGERKCCSTAQKSGEA